MPGALVLIEVWGFCGLAGFGLSGLDFASQSELVCESVPSGCAAMQVRVGGCRGLGEARCVQAILADVTRLTRPSQPAPARVGAPGDLSDFQDVHVVFATFRSRVSDANSYLPSFFVCFPPQVGSSQIGCFHWGLIETGELKYCAMDVFVDQLLSFGGGCMTQLMYRVWGNSVFFPRYFQG